MFLECRAPFVFLENIKNEFAHCSRCNGLIVPILPKISIHIQLQSKVVVLIGPSFLHFCIALDIVELVLVLNIHTLFASQQQTECVSRVEHQFLSVPSGTSVFKCPEWSISFEVFRVEHQF